MLTTQAVMDDAWFGIKYPRNSDSAGLGDWQVNEDKLKGSLDHLVQRINSLKGTTGESMGFGLWVEPEHCNPTSEIFEAHPEWTLHTKVNDKVYTRIQQRFQHVLNLGLVEVQDHLIKVIGDVIASTNIVYVKWDSNKAMDQMPTPSTAHGYMLGLYRVLDNLTSRFPDILWEGCASGGGRFDPGLLHYFPGSWTSDNTDPADRLYIQSGISLVYPPSSMSGHIASIPSQHSHRNTPLEFRAHVSMMCGSFGLELDPDQLTDDEKAQVKGWIVMSERISPLIVRGDLYRLATPDKSNWPAFMYMSRDGSEIVLLAYQLLNRVNNAVPAVRLQGLEQKSKYVIEGGETYTGDTLMNVGLKFPWKGDHDSRILFLSRVSQI
jgi:alpha-galactosidase